MYVIVLYVFVYGIVLYVLVYGIVFYVLNVCTKRLETYIYD